MATPAENPFFRISFVSALGLTWTRMKNWLVSRAIRHGSRLGWTDSCSSWTDWVVARGKSSSGMTGQPYARSNTSRNTDALSVSCTVARSCCRPRCSAGDPPANTAQLSNSIHRYSEKTSCDKILSKNCHMKIFYLSRITEQCTSVWDTVKASLRRKKSKPEPKARKKYMPILKLGYVW